MPRSFTPSLAQQTNQIPNKVNDNDYGFMDGFRKGNWETKD